MSPKRSAALIYTTPDDSGRFGVDIVPDVESGEISWFPVTGETDETWGPDAADAHLSSMGWQRTTPWRFGDLSDLEGWEASIERVGA